MMGPGIDRSNFFLLDKAQLFFKRELPVDGWQAISGSAHPGLPTLRIRRNERWQKRVAKLQPIPLQAGLIDVGAPDDIFATKSTDIFFAGAIDNNSTIRPAGLEQLRRLAECGVRVDIPTEQLSHKTNSIVVCRAPGWRGRPPGSAGTAIATTKPRNACPFQSSTTRRSCAFGLWKREFTPSTILPKARGSFAWLKKRSPIRACSGEWLLPVGSTCGPIMQVRHFARELSLRHCAASDVVHIRRLEIRIVEIGAHALMKEAYPDQTQLLWTYYKLEEPTEFYEPFTLRAAWRTWHFGPGMSISSLSGLRHSHPGTIASSRR